CKARQKIRGTRNVGRAVRLQVQERLSRQDSQASQSVRKPGARSFVPRRFAASADFVLPTDASAATAGWLCLTPWTKSDRSPAPPKIARTFSPPSPDTISRIAALSASTKPHSLIRLRWRFLQNLCASAGSPTPGKDSIHTRKNRCKLPTAASVNFFPAQK